MKELTEYIARSLVDFPDEVTVIETQRGGRVSLELFVAKEDMGRVIGKGGRVANAMRTLVRVAANQSGSQANLEIVES